MRFKSKPSIILFFAILLNFISLIPASAREPCYIVVEGVLTDGSACEGAITIDSSVTSIGNSSFQNVAAITSLVIPNSAVNIGNYAFAGSGLRSVTIPGTLTTIGEAAFRGTELTSITIPNSVTSIGEMAFKDTASLSSVTIGEGLTEIASETFYNSALTALTIPNSVTSIGSYAFGVNRALTSITIGRGVINIGTSAFQDNSALTSISFLGDQPTLGDNVFFSTPSGVIAQVPATAEGFAVNEEGLWNVFTISRVVAPSITLSPSSEEKTVNTRISGYTIMSTGDTITSFTISPFPPAGLDFNSATGVLSGIPTSVMSATSFTISAKNVGGISNAIFVLTVNALAIRDNSSTQDNSAAQAAAKREAIKREARAELITKSVEGQVLTIELLTKAEIFGITLGNIAEFQTEILNLPVNFRSDISSIMKIAYKYEVVGKISSDLVSNLLPNSYVEIGLINVESKHKVALVAAVKRLPAEARKNYASIKAEIDSEMARIQARKERLASVITRNAKRN